MHPSHPSRPRLRAGRSGVPGRRRCGGFTLIEAVVVVGMVSIVAAIAAPSFRSFIGTMNSKSAAFDLINDLTAARSEAIKRNASTSIVPVGSDWSQGWQVRDAGGGVLRVRAALSSSLSISGASISGVVFSANGRASDDTVDANQKWAISSTINGVTARCVVISPTGTARSKTGTC